MEIGDIAKETEKEKWNEKEPKMKKDQNELLTKSSEGTGE